VILTSLNIPNTEKWMILGVGNNAVHHNPHVYLRNRPFLALFDRKSTGKF